MRLKRQRSVAFLAFALLATGVMTLARVIPRVPERAGDFHAYWYPGQFLWQALDPYATILSQNNGGSLTLGSPVFNWALPVNTAPVLFLVSPLSRLPWWMAIGIWTLLNLCLIAVIGWLLITSLQRKILTLPSLALFGILGSLIATREAVENGQFTIFIASCMLAAWVLEERHPVPSGLLLGFALSKYSLAFPLFLLFVFQRRYLNALVSVIVQLFYLLALTAISGNPPWNILSSYLEIMLIQSGAPGMHLMAGLLRGIEPFNYIILFGSSLGLAAILMVWIRRYDQRKHSLTRSGELLLLTIIMLWNLLMFYHRRYDYVLGILLIALVVLKIGEPADEFELAGSQKRGVLLITALVAIVWILPLYLALGDVLYLYLFNLASLAALALAVWLLFRLRIQSPAASLTAR